MMIQMIALTIGTILPDFGIIKEQILSFQAWEILEMIFHLKDCHLFFN